MARQNRLASAPNTMPRPMVCKSEMADNSGIAASVKEVEATPNRLEITFAIRAESTQGTSAA